MTKGEMISRDIYKKIKNMNRKELNDYLKRVWQRGFEVGLNTKAVPKNEAEKNATSETVSEE